MEAAVSGPGESPEAARWRADAIDEDWHAQARAGQAGEPLARARQALREARHERQAAALRSLVGAVEHLAAAVETLAARVAGSATPAGLPRQ